MKTFNIINSSMDGLDVSFRGWLPPSALAALERGKVEAVRTGAATAVTLPGGIVMHVEETGARGGYAYRCDTGPQGETWFFKRSDKDDWNIRVSAKSVALATMGYLGVRARWYELLERIGAAVYEESIGRVDVAFDFTAPDDFRIDPTLVVAHARMKQSGHCDKFAFTPDEVQSPLIVFKGRTVESLTIGKMPGRQVIIYDKTAEVNAKGKNFWWDIWKVAKGRQVYRIEVRAGKKYLKEKLGISKWEEIDKYLASIVDKTLTNIRLCDPAKRGAKNINRTGFHPAWQAVKEWIASRWGDTLQGVPVRVIRTERKRMVKIFEQQLGGSMISFANVCSLERQDFNRFVDGFANRLKRMAKDKRGDFAKKWQKSNNRYLFLTGQLEGQTYRYAAA